MNETVPEGRVIVTDIHMPFWSMVVFLVKLTIAAIPALIILTVLATLLWVVIAGAFVGMHGGIHPA